MEKNIRVPPLPASLPLLSDACGAGGGRFLTVLEEALGLDLPKTWEFGNLLTPPRCWVERPAPRGLSLVSWNYTVDFNGVKLVCTQHIAGIRTILLFCVYTWGSEFRRSELLCFSDPAVDEEEGWERGDILNDRELAEILSNGEGLWFTADTTDLTPISNNHLLNTRLTR